MLGLSLPRLLRAADAAILATTSMSLGIPAVLG
jgi:hypothetical protein